MTAAFATRHELEAMCYYVHDILDILPDLHGDMQAVLAKLEECRVLLDAIASSQA
jgi:hypothetical protein